MRLQFRSAGVLNLIMSNTMGDAKRSASFYHSEAIRLIRALTLETDPDIEAALLSELERAVESGKESAASFIDTVSGFQDLSMRMLPSHARHRAELLLEKVFDYAESTWRKIERLKLDQIANDSSPVPVNSDLTDALMQGTQDLAVMSAVYQDIDRLVALIGDGVDLGSMLQREVNWKPAQPAANLLYFAGELILMQRTVRALELIQEHAQYASFFERDIEPRLSLFGQYLLEFVLRTSARMNTHLSADA